MQHVYVDHVCVSSSVHDGVAGTAEVARALSSGKYRLWGDIVRWTNIICARTMGWHLLGRTVR